MLHPEEIYWGDYEKHVTEANMIFSRQASPHRDLNCLEERDPIDARAPHPSRS